MNKEGEIVIIEDDPDDQEMLVEVFKQLDIPNQIIFFPDGTEVLEYLQKPEVIPFLILSDINLPVLDGFELRNRVFENEQISRKCIPYVFFTTSAEEKSVTTAYALSAQGYFKKPDHFSDLTAIMKSIVEYWKLCYSPNKFRH
ncbi:MAG TPA: response regulator [Flavitalea sp.]|nr:response regulator [Flavitalea sp.]